MDGASLAAAVFLGVAALMYIFLARRTLLYYTCSLSPWAVVAGVLGIVAGVLLVGYVITLLFASSSTILARARIELYTVSYALLRLALFATLFFLFHMAATLVNALRLAVAFAGLIFIEALFGTSVLAAFVFPVLLIVLAVTLWIVWRRAPPVDVVQASIAVETPGADVVVTNTASKIGLSRRNDGNERSVLHGQLTNRGTKNYFAEPTMPQRSAKSEMSAPLIASMLSQPYGQTIYGAQVQIGNTGGLLSVIAIVIASILLGVHTLGCSEVSLNTIIGFVVLIHGAVLYIAAPPA